MQATTLNKLKALFCTIASNAAHLCLPENKAQLDWAMWRFSNIFYAWRYAGEGWDDSLGDFIGSFEDEWVGANGLTEDQVELLQLATCSYQNLVKFGYIHSEFDRHNYICDAKRIKELQESEPSEITTLCAIENKTFDDHKRLHTLRYPIMEDKHGADLMLTYYGNYRFENGYLVDRDCRDWDPMFVYAWKNVPADLMQQLNTLLEDQEVLEIQEVGRKNWEAKMVEYYNKLFVARVPEEFKKDVANFKLGQWILFASDVINMGIKAAKKAPYKLVLGIDPKIKKITKDAHPSYVAAAKQICNRVLNSPASDAKDLKFAYEVLANLDK